MNLSNVESEAELVSLLKITYMEVYLLTTLPAGESVNLLTIPPAGESVKLSSTFLAGKCIEYKINS